MSETAVVQTEADVRWLSYAELAQAFGVKRSSAVRTAFRQGWKRQQGNDGTARVAVPVAVIAAAERRRTGAASSDRQQDRPARGARGGNRPDAVVYGTAFEGALKVIEVKYERHLADLREAHGREVAGLREQVERERQMSDYLRSRLDVAEKAEQRADRLQRKLETTEAELLLAQAAQREREAPQEAAQPVPAAGAAVGPLAAASPPAGSTGARRGWIQRLIRWQ